DLNKNRELIPNHSAETIYTSRGFILCIDLFRIASGFAFAGDSCDISTLLRHRRTAKYNNSHAACAGMTGRKRLSLCFLQ
ncbi:MAG: hypothetical protein LBG45_09810, partial [Dysgonamonadaceae bacterium]|nr:hypothetical protein [Dysgonamonadaceae bacterium]